MMASFSASLRSDEVENCSSLILPTLDSDGMPVLLRLSLSCWWE